MARPTSRHGQDFCTSQKKLYYKEKRSRRKKNSSRNETFDVIFERITNT